MTQSIVNRTGHQRGLPSRRGATWWWMSLLAAVVAVGGIYLSYRVASGTADTTGRSVLLHRVSRGNFEQTVTERGELSSSSNVEVRCYVKSQNTTGTAIIEIVPEGTLVKKGDVICRLDSSALQQDLLQQQILFNTSKAVMIQSQSAYEVAKLARDQYLTGAYKELEETALGDVFVAEENVRRAEQVFNHTRKMFNRGYAPQVQLEADRFAVEKSRMDLQLAQTKLDVLRKYTKEQQLTLLESTVQTSAAKYQADKNSHDLDAAKLADIQQQIDFCTVRAPADGQVVYYQRDNDWDDQNTMIKEGTLVRERQVIAMLPDPNRMQVEVEIKESRVNLVAERMPAVIEIDAIPNTMFHGTVVKVNDYPKRERWRSGAKEYLALVQIEGTHANLRPGLSARVTIQAEAIPQVLQVPVQAVVEESGRHFCLVKQGDRLVPRRVEIGAANDKFVVVSSGLSEQEEVAVNVRQLWNGVLPHQGHSVDEDTLVAGAEHNVAMVAAHSNAK